MAAVVTAPAQRDRTGSGERSEDDRPLPVLPALEPLFAAGGLRRGSAVAVRGSASLLLALLAGPSRRGAWCGVVGLPGLGLLAAAEAGVALDRLALVPDPGPDWAAVTAALLDAMEVVVVAPRGRVADGEVRRLAARARQRGAVLVPYGSVAWPGAEVRLSLAGGSWEGVGDGSGRLRSRRVVVRGEGRGSAARARELPLWLPAADGEVRPDLEPAAPLHAVPTPAEPAADAGRRPAARLRAVPDLPPPGPRTAPVTSPSGARGLPAAPLRAVPAGPSEPRPAGHPVPAGRSPATGGGSLASPPPVAVRPAGPVPAAARGAPPGRPGIPAEVLARLQPASTLPRPPRPARLPAAGPAPAGDLLPGRAAGGPRPVWSAGGPAGPDDPASVLAVAEG